jgi:hypothetical protein
VLVAQAERRGIKSHELGRLQKYVEEIVDAPEWKQAQILTELITELGTRERARGEERRIYPVSEMLPGKCEKPKEETGEPPLDNSGEGEEV